MDYHDLKILHLFSMFLLTSSALLSLFVMQDKRFKILTGLGSLLTLITGMLLMSRFAISHAGPYPTWIWIKLVIWIFLSIGTPVVVKRAPKVAPYLLFPFLVIVLTAMASAVYKPL